jgi:hypothetical protein
MKKTEEGYVILYKVMAFRGSGYRLQERIAYEVDVEDLMIAGWSTEIAEARTLAANLLCIQYQKKLSEVLAIE